MAGSSVLDLILRTRKQGTGAKEAADELKGVRTVLKDLGLDILTTAGVTMTLREGFRQTVGVAQDYDQQVVKIATSLRISTEEASRAIQVADDYAISQESLTAAMRIAQQQGVTPNVEGLAKLSDQYIAITDTQERAKFGLQNLGKNWMEFSRLLEAGGPAIRAQADGIEKGLIVTDKAATASEKYRIALDGMNDSMMAVKVSAGNTIIPILGAAATAGNQMIDMWGRLKDAQQVGAASTWEVNAAVAQLVLGNPAAVTAILQRANAFETDRGRAQDDIYAIEGVKAAAEAAPTPWTITNTIITRHVNAQGEASGQSDWQAPTGGTRTDPDGSRWQYDLLAKKWVMLSGPTKDTTGGRGYAAGGDLPLWGEQLVEVGEQGFEFIHIRDGKATVIPNSAARWMKEAGILPGKGFALDQGGGNLQNASFTPEDRIRLLIDMGARSAGRSLDPNWTPASNGGGISFYDETTIGGGVGGGGGGGGGGSGGAANSGLQSLVDEVSVKSASGAAAAAAAAMASQIPVTVAQQSRAQTQAILQGNDSVVRAINDLGDRIVIAVGDALQKASG